MFAVLLRRITIGAMFAVLLRCSFIKTIGAYLEGSPMFCRNRPVIGFGADLEGTFSMFAVIGPMIGFGAYLDGTYSMFFL